VWHKSLIAVSSRPSSGQQQLCCARPAAASNIGFVRDNPNLRTLPSVHEVLAHLPSNALERFPHALVVAEIRRALDRIRGTLRNGDGARAPDAPEVAREITALLPAWERPSLRRVINATGVILHTNLGRAPLSPATIAPGYSNLEYDLAAGRRGKRDAHIAPLLESLLGAPAIAVNNNAAAVLLALKELASGGEVVVSRGELIEIGDGFRIPDIMAASGAALREVGTTNRTRIADYRAAISERTRLLLRVHPSNFRITGFTERPKLEELAALARERSLPLYEDLGSGCIFDLRGYGIAEPLVSESLAGGADLVSFSGDKLLGGPQAGILAGKPELVLRLRRNPLFRALRLDKVIYAVLENTLRSLLLERWDEIPTMRMIRQTPDSLRARAEALLAQVPELPAEIVSGESLIGGGATPEQALPTWLIAIRLPHPAECERRLRQAEPPVIARIEGEMLLLDLRTVFPEEEDSLAAALRGLAG